MTKTTVKKAVYTARELKRFSSLVDDTGTPGRDNAKRVLARLELNAFIKRHGMEKCRAMDAALRAKRRRFA